MSKTKPISLAQINKSAKQINKTERYYIGGKDDEFINYYPQFANSKIDELLIELVETVNECREKNYDFLKNDDEVLKYAYFLIIKHFTSLKNELVKKDIDTHILTMKALYDNGYFEEFLNVMFDEVEIEKVIDKMYNLQDFALKNKQAIIDRINVVKENTTIPYLEEKIINSIN